MRKEGPREPQNAEHPAIGRFDDFDRFAADYRSQFGELPFETLRRSPQDTPPTRFTSI